MKIRDNFVLQEILDEYIVVPVGEESDRLHCILKLNETGAFLWKALTQRQLTKAELVQLLTNEYDVDEKKASADVDLFIKRIDHLGCMQ